jgi:N-dimethylarginine dimethylaminohydrolase
MNRFLMCPPTHYTAAYEENPWSRVERTVDSKRAEVQWQGLYDWLTAVAAVELMEPIRGLTDLTLTAKSGLMSGGRFIKSRFRQRERRHEEIEIERWFRKNNYEVKTVPEPFCFEGEADFLNMGKEIFAGYHFRSELESLDTVAAMIKRDPLALELKDARFYHLDTCFGPLDDQTAVIFPEAFDAYAYRTLLEMVTDPIWVSETEALRFACNSLFVGKKAAVPLGCPEMRKALEVRGFAVTELDLSEFQKSGSSAKSLVLKL